MAHPPTTTLGIFPTQKWKKTRKLLKNKIKRKKSIAPILVTIKYIINSFCNVTFYFGVNGGRSNRGGKCISGDFN